MDWHTFYIEVNKLVDILKGLIDNELRVRAILDRWVRREHELIVLCTEVVGLPLVSKIEEVFY